MGRLKLIFDKWAMIPDLKAQCRGSCNRTSVRSSDTPTNSPVLERKDVVVIRDTYQLVQVNSWYFRVNDSPKSLCLLGAPVSSDLRSWKMNADKIDLSKLSLEERNG